MESLYQFSVVPSRQPLARHLKILECVQDLSLAYKTYELAILISNIKIK
jgi:hypothetical protein